MNYNVPKDSQVHLQKKSTIKTFNDYPKKDVSNKLIDCIKGGRVTDANYWCAEMLMSGFFSHLWDLLIDYYFRFLICNYPILIQYIHRQQILINQIKKTYVGNLKLLPNNQELRNHLSEMVTMFCLCKKQQSDQFTKGKITTCNHIENASKADRIIQLLIPNLSLDSLIYKHFHSFIINYYDVSETFESETLGLHNCRHYIDWFVRDTSHTIAPFHDFKVPPSISQRCVWLVWKFLLSNLKNQPELTSSLDILTEIFIIHYKRKNYDISTNILWYVLLLARQTDQIQFDNQVDFSHHQIIRQCAEINFIYQNLIKVPVNTSGKDTTKNKAKRRTKQEQSKIEFYENPKNQNFVQTINDVSLLIPKQSTHINSNSNKSSQTEQLRSNKLVKTKVIEKGQSDDLIIPIIVSGRNKSKIKLGE